VIEALPKGELLLLPLRLRSPDSGSGPCAPFIDAHTLSWRIPSLLPVLPFGCAAYTVLVALYEEPEKPRNAIEFIKMTLGAPTGTDVEALKAESEALKVKVGELEAKLADATKKLEEGAAPE
jgi:hypothetical protein